MTMTKTKSDKSEPRSGAQFLPPAWSSPPEVVVDAAAELRNAGLAREAARAARDAAEVAVKAAERRDHQAADTAARSGKQAPPAEVPAAGAQLDGEQRREAAAKRIEDDAVRRLARAVGAAGEEWADREREAMVSQVAAFEASLDAVERDLSDLFCRSSLVAELRTARPGPVEAGRTLRPGERTVQANVGGLLDQVRELARQLVPQSQAALDDERLEAEQRAEENRQWAKMARGGVHVPGGEW